ncbi:MAG: DNA (cytosine-5-)-methyltransferase [Prevotella sp.]|nr:DNA (cytosine-5-)-methyltransferase [Prevotella sp.]
MRHLELFSGIGGFRRAMDLLTHDKIMDFQSVGYSEIDKKAIDTYCANYHPTNNEIPLGDIVTFTKDSKRIEDLPPFELLTGGFPCQTFSMMGKQAGFNEDRGQMFFRIMDIINICKPRYVLLENVKNIVTHDKGQTFARIIYELENIGYHVFYDIFNTADFHLPQTRNRVLIFATKEKVQFGFQYLFNAKSIANMFDKVYMKTSVFYYDDVTSLLSKDVPLKYFLSDQIKPTLLADGSANFKSKSDINMKIARPLTATMHKMHRACQDNYYSQDFIDSKGLINPVLTMSKEELAKLQIRKLTPEEAFMLQGFPNDFASNGRNAGVSDGALYRQAGNAVSVNTVYAILYYLITNKIIHE